MPHKTFTDQSRQGYGRDAADNQFTNEDLKLGCLQRIAHALERIAPALTCPNLAHAVRTIAGQREREIARDAVQKERRRVARLSKKAAGGQ